MVVMASIVFGWGALAFIALVCFAIAALKRSQPRIELFFKKRDLGVIKDAKKLSAETQRLKREKGGDLEAEVEKDLKEIRQGENAADKIKNSL